MRRAFGCIAVTASLLAAPAFAQYSLPATYAGTTNQARGEVRFVVSSTGKRVTKFVFEWRAFDCERTRYRARGKTAAHNLRIADRRFRISGTRRRKVARTDAFSGGTQVERYRVTGALLANGRARGTIRVVVTVFNRFGQRVDTCRMSGRVRWRAAQTGVIVPE